MSHNIPLLALTVWFFVIFQPAPVAPKTFLDDEAGIAAYFQFDGPVNLESNLLTNQFRIITSNNGNYLLGMVRSPGWESYSQMDVKVLVHNDGWAVAYYPSNMPSTLITPREPGGLFTLESVLNNIAEALELEPPTIFFHDFRYPDAEKMIYLEMAPTGQVDRTTEIRLPLGNNYYHRAYYLVSEGLFGTSWLYLDNVEISYVHDGLRTADIPSAKMVPGALHLLRLKTFWGGALASFVVTYSGSNDLPISGADRTRLVSLGAVPQALRDAAADVPRTYHSFIPIILK